MPHFTGLTFLLDPRKETVYATGSILTGYSMTAIGKEWRLMIKVRTPKGRNLVAFIFAPEPYLCYQLWWDAMTTTSFHLKWKEDEYA